MMVDQEAENAFSKAAEYSLKANSWGLFSYSDVPSAFCGSGRGAFPGLATRKHCWIIWRRSTSVPRIWTMRAMKPSAAWCAKNEC